VAPELWYCAPQSITRIYGVPSDPLKTARMKALNRAWTGYIQNGGARDAVYLNASRLAVKAGVCMRVCACARTVCDVLRLCFCV
jgi:hypothetical protein